ncbi:MAG: RICIN domain-containing protein [Bacteroidota bacterium]
MRKIVTIMMLTFWLTSFIQAQPTTAPGQDIVGYGYDVFGKFADNESLKNYCLFDWGDSYDKNFGSYSYSIPGSVMLKNVSQKERTEASGADKRSYAKSFSSSVGLGVDAMLFSASVNSTFSQSSSGSSARYFHTIRDANRTWQIAIDERNDHKEMLKPKVKEDIDNMPPAKLFDIYGTHYIASAYLGGRADYSSVTKITTSMDSKTIGATVEAQYKAISADASTEMSEQQKQVKENTKTKLTVTGGNAEYANDINNYEAYENWAAGIRDMPVLCDFDEKSLIPIWELASTQSRKNKLKAYFDKVLVKNHELPESMVNLVSLADKVYRIKSKGTDKYWDLKGSNTAAQGRRGVLQMYDSDLKKKNKIGADRYFKILPHKTESDYVFLQPQHVNMVVDIKGGSKKEGAVAHLWSHGKNNAAQMFKMEPVEDEDNTYYLVAKCSGLYLTAGEVSSNDGKQGIRSGGKKSRKKGPSANAAPAPATEVKNHVKVKQQKFTGAENQKWVFEETDPKLMAPPYDYYSIYNVQCVDGGKYWDFDGKANNNKNGSRLKLWSMSWGPDDRFIKLQPADKDKEYFYIRPTWTTRVLDVSMGSINKNGGKIQIWDKNSEAQQLFSFEYAGAPNTWYIKNKRSGKYIDASSGEVNKNGGKVQQWEFHGGDNQKWVLRSYPRIADAKKLKGTYHIKSAHSKKYWDLPGSDNESKGKGEQIKLWSLDGGADRKVKIKPTGDHSWVQIIFQNGHKAADVKGTSKNNGGELHTWDPHGGNSQKWGIYITGKTTFVLVNKNSRKAVDVDGGKINENGPKCHQWSRHNGKSQQWQLIDPKTKKPVNLFSL